MRLRSDVNQTIHCTKNWNRKKVIPFPSTLTKTVTLIEMLAWSIVCIILINFLNSMKNILQGKFSFKMSFDVTFFEYILQSFTLKSIKRFCDFSKNPFKLYLLKFSVFAFKKSSVSCVILPMEFSFFSNSILKNPARIFSYFPYRF